MLSYKPRIIVATPGRLWELISDQMDPYLLKTLPMVDVLVLDEADRMIADGHFKEMRDILAHVYTRRLQLKTQKKSLPKGVKETAEIVQIEEMKKDAAKDSSNFIVGKNLEQGGVEFDMNEVEDLYDEDELFEEIKQEGNIILDQSLGGEPSGVNRRDKSTPKKPKTLS